MHYSVLYFEEGKKLEDVDLSELEEDFGIRYCYDFEDSVIYDEELDEYVENPDFEVPEEHIHSLCDWFQVGGRWEGVLKASKGEKGSLSWMSTSASGRDGYSIAEVDDLDEGFLQSIEDWIYSVATESAYYEKGSPEYEEFITRLKNRQLKGVVSIIDCHD